jgi:hypothetical protein
MDKVHKTITTQCFKLLGTEIGKVMGSAAEKRGFGTKHM